MKKIIKILEVALGWMLEFAIVGTVILMPFLILSAIMWFIGL